MKRNYLRFVFSSRRKGCGGRYGRSYIDNGVLAGAELAAEDKQYEI